MIRSMTGYGAAQTRSNGWVVSVEARSVNHRSLDLHVHSPRNWPWLEKRSVEFAKELLQRGRVDVRIDVQRDYTDKPRAIIDHEQFSIVASELAEVAATNELAGGVTLSDVLSFSQVRAKSDTDVEELEEEDWGVAVLRTAIGELVATRVKEGERLGKTMCSLLDAIMDEVTQIEAVLKTELDAYRDRLKSRVDDAIQKFGLDEVDESRVIQEVVLYADKSAIAEEIQRAFSHIEQLRGLILDDRDDVRGKQIDFYLQELMREASTMGAKSGSILVTDSVVRIKTALGKMREQAANIE